MPDDDEYTDSLNAPGEAALADASGRSPAIPIGDRYLDIKQARAELQRLGINVTDRKMRQIVRERQLPFFRSVDSKWRIERRVLLRCFEQRQVAASDAFEQTAGATQPNEGEHR